VLAWLRTSPGPPFARDALEARTDADGYYRVTPVPGGNYYVAAFAHGLVPVQIANISESPRSVSISAGEAVRGVDLQLIVGGVITGRITNLEGKPVASHPMFLVEVTPLPNPTGMHPNPAMMQFSSGIFRTDDSGVYRIDGIPPGSYRVAAGPPYAAFKVRGQPPYEQAFYGNTKDQSKARVIEVSEGAVMTDIDINVGAPVPTSSASGRIVSAATGQPLPDISYDIFIDGPSGRGGLIPQAGKSGSDGSFKLLPLPPGRYSVRISDGRSIGPPVIQDFFGESAPFEIGNADVSALEVRAFKSLTIAGVVVAENTRDQSVLNKLPQLSLIAAVEPKGGGHSISQLFKPNADGSFVVYNLRAGKLRIHLNSRTGESLGFRGQGIRRAGSGLVREIEIGDEPTVGLQVVLAYGSQNVRGRVKLENGTLPDDARACVRLTNEKGFYADSCADSQGKFLIEAVPAGAYTLTVSAEVPGRRTLGVEAHQQIVVSADRPADATLVLDLAPLRSPAP